MSASRDIDEFWKRKKELPVLNESELRERVKRLERALLMCEAISMFFEEDQAMTDIYLIAHSARGSCSACAPNFEDYIQPIERVMIRNRAVDKCPLCGKPSDDNRPHQHCIAEEQARADLQPVTVEAKP